MQHNGGLESLVVLGDISIKLSVFIYLIIYDLICMMGYDLIHL